MMPMPWRFIALALIGMIAPLHPAAGAVDSAPLPAPAAANGKGPAVVISLAGEVNDFNRDALFRNFNRARQLGAKTVILEINTYGGLVPSAMDISRFLRRQDDMHTIAFINDRAISAGAMIALACDEIVMAPQSTLGDCAPIIFTPEGKLHVLAPAERAKEESPVVEDFRESARQNGYDPLLATAMVSVETTVYYVQDDQGHRRFVDAQQYKDLTAEGWKPVPGVEQPVDGPTSLLTVSTDTALKLGLAKSEARSSADLAAQRGYTIVGDLTPGLGDRFVGFFNLPWVRMLLMMAFLISLFVALHVPGHGAAEAITVLSMALLVGIPLLTGYATWWEVALILGGIGLIAFEVFVFPGHFVSAALGSVMMLVGILLTFLGDFWMPGAWEMPATWNALSHGLYATAGALVGSFILCAWLRSYLPRLPYFNRLILTTTSGQPIAKPSAKPDTEHSEDVWPFIGTVGRAVSELRPGGSASFPFGNDVRGIAVVSDGTYVPADEKIIVKEVRGNRVVVRPLA